MSLVGNMIANTASGAAAGSVLGPIGSVAGAGIGLLGDIFGGLLGNRSTDKTNQTNLQIAREQNQFNLEQWQRERDFSLEMWNKENAYNDPSAQKSRLLAAGINPYLADINSGNASALTSPAGNPAAGATMQPKNFDYIGNGFNGAVANYMQLRQADEQLKSLALQNQYQSLKNDEQAINNSYQAENWKWTINNAIANYNNRYWDTEQRKQSFSHTNMTFPELYNQEVQRTKNMVLQNEGQRYANNLAYYNSKIQEMHFDWLPKEKAQNFKIMLAQELANNANAAAGFASARLSIQQAFKVAAEKVGIDANNEHMKKMYPIIEGFENARRIREKNQAFREYWSSEHERARIRKNRAGGFFDPTRDISSPLQVGIADWFETMNPFKFGNLFK